MMPHEVALMLTTASVFDGRKFTELDAGAWCQVLAAAGLADLTAEDANAAVIAHYAGTRQWLMPSDVVDRCKAMRRDRIRTLNGSGQLARMITADPLDGPAWHAERQRITRDVAAGRRPIGELEAGR